MPKTFVAATRSPLLPIAADCSRLQPIMDRFVPRDDTYTVIASEAWQSMTPLPSWRAQRGNPRAATNMDRFVPRDDTYTVMASEAWQSKTPHPQHINTRTLT